MGKLAIVLAGGGSRGAYQIGVWKALREMGIEYHIVTGASVGALNGAMMVQGGLRGRPGNVGDHPHQGHRGL